MHKVIMPKVGPDMEFGTIQKWLRKEGEKVEAGDVLLEITTDKASLEVEATDSGYLKKILYSEGEEIQVGDTIAYIGSKNEKVS